MKKLIFALSFLTFTTNIFCQVNQYSKPADANFQNTYVSPDFDMILKAGLERQARYDQNIKYLYALKDWILDIKSKTNDAVLLRVINSSYEKLKKLENTDLSLKEKELKTIEYEVRETVEKYNKKLNEQNDPQNIYSKGLAKMNKGKFQEAKIIFTLLITDKTAVETGYLLRAQCDYQMQNYSMAINDLTTLISLNPTNIAAHELRGWCYLYSEKYMEGMSDFNFLVDNAPENPIGYFGRGYAKSNLGDKKGSNKDYEKTIELNPNHSMAYNNIGWNYFENEDYNKALEYINKALEIDTKNNVAWDSRGEINFMLDNYKQAINDLNRAIEINPKQANAFLVRGRANYKLGNTNKACEDWSKAGELGKFDAYEFIDKYCNN